MNCKYLTKDGAGEYCMLRPMHNEEDYPHQYWRVSCHGNTESIFCEGQQKDSLIYEIKNDFEGRK